jgi:hypothetical protein
MEYKGGKTPTSLDGFSYGHNQSEDLSAKAAAGILGNLEAQSGLSPGAKQPMSGPDNCDSAQLGYTCGEGLAQWDYWTKSTGYSDKNRWQIFVKWADSKSTPKSPQKSGWFTTQLYYIVWSLFNVNYQAAELLLNTNKLGIHAASSGNAGGATWDFMAYYESESGYANSTDLSDTVVFTDEVWDWYHHITKFTVK